MKCAIVVGHKQRSQGAVNKSLNVTEFEFNKELADCIYQASIVNTEIVLRDTYKALPDKINNISPDFIISLHCNAFNKKASGSEVLYYHSSRKSESLARILIDNIHKALPIKNRGIKPKHSEDRGGYLLRNTYAPCVIAEPFFIDNDKDLELALSKQDELVDAYVRAIRQFSNTLP